MTFSADLYEIAVLLIAIAFLVLAVSAVPFIAQMKRTAKAFEDLTAESRKAVENVNYLLKKAGEQAGDIEELVKKINDVGLKFISLADILAENIRGPLITIISLIFGIEGGFRRFFGRKNTGGESDERQ